MLRKFRQQQEFKTGLRKAVSVLNSAIAMNIALDGETPYDNHDLFHYLQKHMSVIKSTTRVMFLYSVKPLGYEVAGNEYCGNIYQECGNAAFYTTDGMRFEVYIPGVELQKRQDYPAYLEVFPGLKLHESNLYPHVHTSIYDDVPVNNTYKCGSYGLANNPNNTTETPCYITVDVNGDRKPYPANINSTNPEDNSYIGLNPNSKKIRDVFGILITEDRAIPFGVLAQKAMYQAQK